MTPDNLANHPDSDFIETRASVVKTWSEINIKLPSNFTERERKLLRQYFRAQLRIANGGTKKAERIFDSLDKQKDYEVFEQKRMAYLAAVDVAVRGKTQLPIEPAFTVGNGKSKL